MVYDLSSEGIQYSQLANFMPDTNVKMCVTGLLKTNFFSSPNLRGFFLFDFEVDGLLDVAGDVFFDDVPDCLLDLW